MPDALPTASPAQHGIPPANAVVASRLRLLADLLELEDANPFRIRAYRAAADTVLNLSEDVARIVDRADGLQRLDAMPGIGEDLARKIAEICRTGQLGLLNEAQTRLPAHVIALLALPGLGPVRIRRLQVELGIQSVEDLRAAVAAGRLGGLPGFGAALQRRLADALSRRPPQRTPRSEAQTAAQALREALLASPGVEKADIAGSLRRGRPDVGDVDLVAASSSKTVTRAFAALPQVEEVLACGPSRATVRLAGGLQADLLVVEPQSYGAALLHFTGSKAHNIALRRLARSQGLKLNERGLFKGARQVAGQTEAQIYAALGLAEPPPWLRESGSIGGDLLALRRRSEPNMAS